MNMIMTGFAKSDEVIKIVVRSSCLWLARTINVVYQDVSYPPTRLFPAEAALSIIAGKDFISATTIEPIVAFTCTLSDATRQTDGIGQFDRILSTDDAQPSLAAFLAPFIGVNTHSQKALRAVRSAILCRLTTPANALGFSISLFSSSFSQTRLATCMVWLRRSFAAVNTNLIDLTSVIKFVLVTVFGHVHLQGHYTTLNRCRQHSQA